MDRFDAIRTLIHVVEAGSFSAAARQAGLGQPALSKQVAALEARLGAQLLQRTSRGLALTEAGQALYEAGLRLLADLEAAEALVGRRQIAPAGLVRLSTAPVFGRLYVTPQLPSLLRMYPELTVEIAATSQSIDFVEDGIDLAIRHGAQPDSSLIGRVLGASPTVTVAAPSYIDRFGAPATPAQLVDHECVVFLINGDVRPLMFAGPNGPSRHRPAGRFRTGDAEQSRAAVLAGLGIAQAPLWIFAPDIATGAVIPVLADYAPPPISISLLRAAGRRLPARTRVVADFLDHTLTRDRRLWGRHPDAATPAEPAQT